MLDLMPLLSAWPPLLAGQPFAVATVVAAGGSVPRPVGTSMLVSGSGAVLGSLSGGCVEGAVVALALESLADGGTRRETFGDGSAEAFAAGLTCGGALEVHIEPAGAGPGHPLGEALRQLATHRPGYPVALVRRMDAGNNAVVVIRDPATFGPAEARACAGRLGFPDASDQDGSAAAQLQSVVRGGSTGLLQLPVSGTCPAERMREPAEEGGQDTVTLLVESRLPAPRMLLCGANDFGAALLPAAKLLGYSVTVVDARPAFSTQARFSCADAVVTDWPHRYLAAEAAAGRLDRRTVLCILSHDPKFDLPLLETALALDLGYVGAMGSRQSHLQRVNDLLGAGVRPERIAQLHSPIGLDVGAVTPAEVAVSVTAEIIAARSRAASCLPLRDTSGPVHQRPIEPEPAAEPASSRVPDREIAWT